MWNPYSQRCERQKGLGQLDEGLALENGGFDSGFYELPYYEPVYFEPVPEPIAQIVVPDWVAEPEPFIAPMPEPIVEEKPMAEDFYIDDYGGSYYNGGYAPIDYAPEFELLPQQEPQFFELPYEGFEPLPFEPLPGEFDFFPLPYVDEPLPDLPIFLETPFFPELPFTPLPEIGFLEPLPPIELFAETIQMETEPGLMPTQQPVILPEPLSPILPFVPTPIDFEPFDFFPLPYVPIGEQPPAPPTQKLGPCNTPNGLPGSCAAGFYHPQYDPCACIPFPSAPPTTQTPRPLTPSPAPAPAPRPPTQQQPQQQARACPTGYCKHPQTGQCMPIPAGYQRHPQTQVCVLATQQITTTTETEDVLANLKKLPWWVWAGLAGVFVLGQGGGKR